RAPNTTTPPAAHPALLPRRSPKRSFGGELIPCAVRAGTVYALSSCAQTSSAAPFVEHLPEGAALNSAAFFKEELFSNHWRIPLRWMRLCSHDTGGVGSLPDTFFKQEIVC
ncbi:MAG TPA: hypothetical protein VF458_08575, partial [Ktedonobacteraceae bacterium]